VLEPFLLTRSAHGMVGVLAAAALSHPALMRVPSARNALPASVLAVLTFAGGVLIYGDYRAGPKRVLLGEALWLAQAFEVKEHLGFFVAVLAIAGAGLLRAGAVADARRCYQAGAALAWVVVATGWLVSGWG